jgi:hypothetical protein
VLHPEIGFCSNRHGIGADCPGEFVVSTSKSIFGMQSAYIKRGNIKDKYRVIGVDQLSSIPTLFVTLGPSSLAAIS